MGLIRGGLFYISILLLLISFISMNLLLTLYLSLDYQNIKPELDLIAGQLGVTDSSELYYKDYEDCSVWDIGKFVDTDNGKGNCLTYFISEQAMEYWSGKFVLLLLVSLVLIVAMFFLFESKANFLIGIGILFILASLPFIKLSWFLTMFFNKSLFSIFSSMFNQAYRIFIMSFSVGLFLVLMGIGFKIWGFGIFIEKKVEGAVEENKEEKEKEEVKEVEEKKENIKKTRKSSKKG